MYNEEYVIIYKAYAHSTISIARSQNYAVI